MTDRNTSGLNENGSPKDQGHQNNGLTIHKLQVTNGLTIHKLQVTKGKRPILQDINLQIRPRCVTTVIGPNGAGKSTLLRTMAGLEPAYKGDILWNGRSIFKLDTIEHARCMAWVPDNVSVPFSFTVEDIVMFGRFPTHQGHPQSKDRNRVHETLRMLEASHLAKRPVNSLSSGEFRKAMIARGLAADTPILLLDEPCANLDIKAALELGELLRALSSERTILISAHDMTFAARYGDQMICLTKGKACASGSPSEVLTSAIANSVFGVEMEELQDASGRRSVHFVPLA